MENHELKKVEKYTEAINLIIKQCQPGERINYKLLNKSGVYSLHVMGLEYLGYIRRLSRGRYATNIVKAEPWMGRKLLTWVKETQDEKKTLRSLRKQEAQVVDPIQNEVDATTPSVVEVEEKIETQVLEAPIKVRKKRTPRPQVAVENTKTICIFGIPLITIRYKTKST